MPDCLKTAPLLFQVIRFLHKYWGYEIPACNRPLVVTVKATTALGEPLNQEALAIRTACQLFTDNMMVFISSDEDRLIIHSLYAMMDSLLEVARIGLRSEPNWSQLWWKQE
jgi:hypothetical protein